MCFILEQKTFKLSNKLVLHWVEYDLDAYKRDLFSQFVITPPSELADWVKKRQAQFLAGRIAAKNSLPVDYKHQTVGIGQHREPLWPKGIMGSISHGKSISIALSQEKNIGGIGVDIQTTFSDKEAKISRKIILNHTEKELLRENPFDLSHKQLLTLIFSSKESFFKAVFSQVGGYFDFKDVSVMSVDTQALQIRIVTHIKLTEKITANQSYVIDYQWINKNRVITSLIHTTES